MCEGFVKDGYMEEIEKQKSLMDTGVSNEEYNRILVKLENVNKKQK